MKLGLGTVQFGLDYGISNQSGMTPGPEVAKILKTAAEIGIEIIDSAPSYGTSETHLGEILNGDESFKIVTKTPHLGGCSIADDAALLTEKTFMQSLGNLRCNSVYGLLVHNSEDLLSGMGDHIMEKMKEMKQKGFVRNIGISIYTAKQLDMLLDRYPVDIIQLPLNVFDQRLIESGHIDKLISMGIEIHVRSAFLQGILLMKADELPSYFDTIKGHLQRFQKTLQLHNLTLLQGALAFLNTLSGIDCTICGVNNNAQLKEIHTANIRVTGIDFKEFALHDEHILNPQQWPRVQ